MSLFLGKIHYWLYDKIVLFEKLEGEIILWAKNNELPIEGWLENIRDEYGIPLGNESLEEIIDTNNIHGWLQDKISKAEIRQAYIITNILNLNEKYIKDLSSIYQKQGKVLASTIENQGNNTPQDLHKIVFDYLLEGMPCERVQEVIKSNENEFIWKTTTCIHKKYWDLAKGDINNFYILRDIWIEAFVNNIDDEFKFNRVTENIQKIIKTGE